MRCVKTSVRRLEDVWDIQVCKVMARPLYNQALISASCDLSSGGWNGLIRQALICWAAAGAVRLGIAAKSQENSGRFLGSFWTEVPRYHFQKNLGFQTSHHSVLKLGTDFPIQQIDHIDLGHAFYPKDSVCSSSNHTDSERFQVTYFNHVV